MVVLASGDFNQSGGCFHPALTIKNDKNTKQETRVHQDVGFSSCDPGLLCLPLRNHAFEAQNAHP